MKAMLSTAPGGPETLELTEMPQPEPKKGQVRIRIRAAGLNFPDTLIIKDLYQMKPPTPSRRVARFQAMWTPWERAFPTLLWATGCWR